MWQSVNAQTSATHQTLWAKNIAYQPLLIITHIQLTHYAACDKGLTLKRQLRTKAYQRKEHAISILIDYNPYSAYSVCCMWQSVNARNVSYTRDLTVKNISKPIFSLLANAEKQNLWKSQCSLTSKHKGNFNLVQGSIYGPVAYRNYLHFNYSCQYAGKQVYRFPITHLGVWWHFENINWTFWDRCSVAHQYLGPRGPTQIFFITGGSDRGSYFIPKKFPTSEFVHSKKSLSF